jgi:prevent-host-death family protein
VQTLSIQDVQAHLAELIAKMQPGEEIIITQEQKPVARLVGEKKPLRSPRQLGTLKGTVLFMAPDFDAPLEEFREYME